MRAAALSFILLLGALGSSGIAMKPHHEATVGQCRITAGSKLPADTIQALCSEVKRAIEKAAPGVRFDAEVKALSASRLSAMLTVNGRKLPEQHFAVMDSNLDAASVRRFAESLAEEVATAAKR